VDGGADFALHVNMQTNLTVGTGIIATTGNIEATAGYLKSGLGRWPTGEVWGAGVTENYIFDQLSPYIPNTSNVILLHGSYLLNGAETTIYIASSAKRLNSTRIELTGLYWNGTGGGLISTFIDDAGTDTYDISIFW
jgi:hypothetical protein